jgi:small multidrug resistance pump
MTTHATSLTLIAAALCFTIGAVYMKQSEGFAKAWPSALLLVFFTAGTCLLTFAMRGGAMSITYIVELGLEALLALAFGWLLFEEQLSALKLAGVVAIVGGIAALRL